MQNDKIIILLLITQFMFISSSVFSDPDIAIKDGQAENEAAFQVFKRWAKDAKLEGNVAAYWQEYVTKGHFTAQAAAYGRDGLVYMPTVFRVDWNKQITRGFEDPEAYDAPMDIAVRKFKKYQQLEKEEKQVAKRLAGRAYSLSTYQTAIQKSFNEYLAEENKIWGAAVDGAKKEIKEAFSVLNVDVAVTELANNVVSLRWEDDVLQELSGNVNKKDSLLDAAKMLEGKVLDVAQTARNAAFLGSLKGISAVVETRHRLAARMERLSNQIKTLRQLMERDEQTLTELSDMKKTIW